MLSKAFEVKDCNGPNPEQNEMNTIMSGWLFGILTILSPLILFGFLYGTNAIGRSIKKKFSK